jgi:hypothetical protein
MTFSASFWIRNMDYQRNYVCGHVLHKIRIPDIIYLLEGLPWSSNSTPILKFLIILEPILPGLPVPMRDNSFYWWQIAFRIFIDLIWTFQANLLWIAKVSFRKWNCSAISVPSSIFVERIATDDKFFPIKFCRA